MPRKEQGWITFQVSNDERKLLEELSEKLQRTKTEILREMLRGLNQPLSSRQSISVKNNNNTNNHSTKIANSDSHLKVSSNNIFKGVVTKVVRTEITSKVTLKVVHEVELTSIIATDSADELELYEGTEVYAVINSNNIVIAKN